MSRHCVLRHRLSKVSVFVHSLVRWILTPGMWGIRETLTILWRNCSLVFYIFMKNSLNKKLIIHWGSVRGGMFEDFPRILIVPRPGIVYPSSSGALRMSCNLKQVWTQHFDVIQAGTSPSVSRAMEYVAVFLTLRRCCYLATVSRSTKRPAILHGHSDLEVAASP